MKNAEKAVSEALPSAAKPLFDAYEEAIEQYVWTRPSKPSSTASASGLRIAVEVYTKAAQGA